MWLQTVYDFIIPFLCIFIISLELLEVMLTLGIQNAHNKATLAVLSLSHSIDDFLMSDDYRWLTFFHITQDQNNNPWSRSTPDFRKSKTSSKQFLPKRSYELFFGNSKEIVLVDFLPQSTTINKWCILLWILKEVTSYNSTQKEKHA